MVIRTINLVSQDPSCVLPSCPSLACVVNAVWWSGLIHQVCVCITDSTCKSITISLPESLVTIYMWMREVPTCEIVLLDPSTFELTPYALSL